MLRTAKTLRLQFRIVAAACDHHGKDKRGKVNLYDKLYEEYVAPGRDCATFHFIDCNCKQAESI